MSPVSQNHVLKSTNFMHEVSMLSVAGDSTCNSGTQQAQGKNFHDYFIFQLLPCTVWKKNKNRSKQHNQNTEKWRLGCLGISHSRIAVCYCDTK